jgi:hypothetical protein
VAQEPRARGPSSTGWTDFSGNTATITCVGFFDIKPPDRRRTEAIELHPVISFRRD